MRRYTYTPLYSMRWSQRFTPLVLGVLLRQAAFILSLMLWDRLCLCLLFGEVDFFLWLVRVRPCLLWAVVPRRCGVLETHGAGGGAAELKLGYRRAFRFDLLVPVLISRWDPAGILGRGELAVPATLALICECVTTHTVYIQE